MRNDDLDRDRCKPAFVEAMFEDLRWAGFEWQEGPDFGGPHAPYEQSGRMELYRGAFERLRAAGFLYPCTCSRKDIAASVAAPHAMDEEPVYPGTCRNRPATDGRLRQSWRFRVPDGERVEFKDGGFGAQAWMAGRDFGDFIVWRHDGVPAYQLACVVDDALMGITEVVRGADLLASTARQWLLYRALGWSPPAFFHCPLMTDDQGVRLAKRHDALGLRTLRERGLKPEDLRRGWADEGRGP